MSSGRPLLAPAGGREAAARRVGGRGRRRRRGRGRREAALLADAAHVLQDAHGVRHQHARRLLRAAPRRRGLLPASGTLGLPREKKKFHLFYARLMLRAALLNQLFLGGVQDYSQQRPSQELVAKDLHGTEWRFRHIYRGTSTNICTHTSSSLGFCTVYWFALNDSGRLNEIKWQNFNR